MADSVCKAGNAGVLKTGSRADASQVRNPLALAHFANHPAAGRAANVMVAPLQLSPQHMANAGVPQPFSGREFDNVSSMRCRMSEEHQAGITVMHVTLTARRCL